MTKKEKLKLIFADEIEYGIYILKAKESIDC